MAKIQNIPPGIDQHGLLWRVRISRAGFKINETFASLEDAVEFRHKTIAEIRGRSYVSRSVEQTTTLHSVLGRYLKEVTPLKGGAKAEANRIKAWQRESWAKLPITSITSSHITAWRDAKLKAGKAPSTIYNAMNILSTVFKIAKAEWSIKVDNPLLGIRRPAQSEPRVAIPNDHLERLLIAKIRDGGLEDTWLNVFFQVAGWTAMRQGEVRALMWGDINFKDHLIYVRAELEGAKKNKTSRDVPMLPIVEKLLLEWRDADWRDKKPETLEWVFPSLKPQKIEELKNKPDRLSDSTVSTAFKRVVDQVIFENPTIKSITFHDLRHWGCTRLAPFHNDALDLAKTTGHKSIKMLQRYYNPDPVSRAVRIRAKAAELFSKTK